MDDVVKNVRHFVDVVKKSITAPKEKDTKAAKNNKPSELR